MVTADRGVANVSGRNGYSIRGERVDGTGDEQ